jgi:predicted XRE-type DNA-binding protein
MRTKRQDNKKQREDKDSKRSARGWRSGSAQEFLGLSDDEAAFIAIRLHLAKAMQNHRKELRLTQAATAKLLASSQSRVAKMEAGDPGVTVDLLIRSLLKLGASPAGIGRELGRVG